MVQFDVRAADRLWEGIPPEHGAPGWYDDVSGLIETANGPAEPHELVDEPVVVEDMHKTTLGGPRRCRQGRTVGRLIAMKAAAATTASVVGVAATAAATTGIVATVASVVVPVIEEHVLPADVAPAPPPPTDPAPPPDAAPVDPVSTDLPPATDPAATDPAPADRARTDPPLGSGPIESAAIESEPAGPPQAGDPAAVEPSPDGASHQGVAPPDQARPDKGRPGGDEPVDADAHGHNSWPGRSHRGGRQVHHGDARAATPEPVEQAPAADSRRPD